MRGFIYFAERDGLVKIGFSATPAQRVHNLGSKMLGCIVGERKDERALHRMFSSAWVEGEWFKLTIGLVEYIQTHVGPLELPGPNSQVLAVRVPPQLKRQLKRLAGEDQRTISNLVEVLLT